MGELKATTTSRRRPWRENLEALTMAIVVALLFKYFILEISKIPSGSMQPTLMGNKEASVFDRVLVDKLSMRFRDPERFEIVVFKHPLERSRIMVKRLVGMPDEDLKIEYGDLWVRPHGGDAPWSILRPPQCVQAEMWRALDGDPRRASWSVLRGGKGWKISGGDVVARGTGRIRFRADDGPITDHYLDGYPPSLHEKMGDSGGRNPVGDLRVAGEVEAGGGLEFLVIELTEGLRAYEFRVPGAAAPAGASAEIRVRDSGASNGDAQRVARADGVRLDANQRASFAAQNLDDRLTLELDGRAIATLDIEPNEQQEAAITLGIDGEGAELEDLEVCRDIYYLPPDGARTWTVSIPPKSYVMLGDNTQDSADSRLWKAKTYAYAGEKVRGNWREGGENPAFGTLPSGASALRFRDEWGEIHWLDRGALEGEDVLSRNAPVPNPPVSNPPVPRELIVGRAVAVFWPIKPFQKLWRLGWLH